MDNSADLFKSSIDKAFTSQPNVKLNTSTITDAMKYKQGFNEEDLEEDETTEATGSGSSGAYSGPLFSGEEPEINDGKKVETKEATTSGSVGGYSSPSMWAKTTKKKDWGPSRKPQIPGGGFVKVKKKCTKFPYCNQGDINAVKITKNESVREAIKNVSSRMNISENIIRLILEDEYKKLDKTNK